MHNTAKKQILKLFLLLALAVFLFNGIFVKKGELVYLIESKIHYYSLIKSGDFRGSSMGPVPVFISKKLSPTENYQISSSLAEAKKMLSGYEIKGLRMVTYLNNNSLPSFLKKSNLIKRDLKSRRVKGFYSPNLREIYIFTDVVNLDNTYADKQMLYETLHEIGHHIDLYVQRNVIQESSESRANDIALSKIYNFKNY